MKKDQDRKAKIELLLQKLQTGRHVQNRDLKTWLTVGAWNAYEDELRIQQELRSDITKKPNAVREYERRIEKANFAYNKGEGFSVRGNSAAARSNFDKADVLYERALEHLQQAVAADPSLCVWFDRDTSWTADSEISLCPSAVPHVVTSRSLDNRGGGILRQLRSKRDLKIAAVEQALAELAEEAEGRKDSKEGVMSERLKRLLALRDDN